MMFLALKALKCRSHSANDAGITNSLRAQSDSKGYICPCCPTFPFLSGWYVASISSGGVVMCDTGTWLRHISGTRLLERLTMDGQAYLVSIFDSKDYFIATH